MPDLLLCLGDSSHLPWGAVSCVELLDAGTTWGLPSSTGWCRRADIWHFSFAAKDTWKHSCTSKLICHVENSKASWATWQIAQHPHHPALHSSPALTCPRPVHPVWLKPRLSPAAVHSTATFSYGKYSVPVWYSVSLWESPFTMRGHEKGMPMEGLCLQKDQRCSLHQTRLPPWSSWCHHITALVLWALSTSPGAVKSCHWFPRPSRYLLWSFLSAKEKEEKKNWSQKAEIFGKVSWECLLSICRSLSHSETGVLDWWEIWGQDKTCSCILELLLWSLPSGDSQKPSGLSWTTCCRCSCLSRRLDQMKP